MIVYIYIYTVHIMATYNIIYFEPSKGYDNVGLEIL